MTVINEWFAGLFTVGGSLYLLTGYALAFISRWVYCKLKHENPAIPWRAAGIVVGIIVMLTTGFQSQYAYVTANQTAQDNKECQKQFNSALKARVKITTDNDEVSQNQRKIIFDWIHNLIFPPPPYNTMDTNDPRRQNYGLAVTINTDHEFRKSLDKQEELQRQRDAHPLPDPTCGK